MSKDWIGNAESAFKQLGASNHCSDDREENDFYATDPRAITDLVYRENFSKDIWECAVGQGHLAQRLKEYGFNVKCSDIVDRGYPNTEIVDFLKTTIKFNGDIVTNPPYKYCAEFILKALEGSKRYEEIYSKYPPKTIYVYVKRIQCAKNGEFKGSSAVCYAWFVWQKGFKGDTVLKWIN